MTESTSGGRRPGPSEGALDQAAELLAQMEIRLAERVAEAARLGTDKP